jgi:AraC-like DNA-binding protein
VDSSVSVFSETSDLQTALRDTGYLTMLQTSRGRFRARMIRLGLSRFWLTSTEERSSRVAFVSVPPGLMRLSLPTLNGSLTIGGRKAEMGELIVYGAGSTYVERVEGPCEWNDIVLSVENLSTYLRTLHRTQISPPIAARVWRGSPHELQSLMDIHAAAINLTLTRAGRAPTSEAARGLEHELMTAIVACLPTDPILDNAATLESHAVILARFRELIESNSDSPQRMTNICRALGISDRTLRKCCQEQLGMSPSRYLHLYRMNQARRALRRTDPTQKTVLRIARDNGFREAGRFAISYQALFGERPSVTLRQHPDLMSIKKTT